jgi:hypothetical protein
MFHKEEIAQNLCGAWQVMLGRREGLRLLDTTAEGFWRSFTAMLIGAPALLATCFSSAKWNTLVSELSSSQYIFRAVIVEIAAWILPLIVLGLVMGRLRLGHRFAAYAVASNWANLIILYFMLPIDLLGIFLAQNNGVMVTLGFSYITAAIVFMFRITQVSFGTDYPVSIALFLSILVFTLFVALGLQNVLGLS